MYSPITVRVSSLIDRSKSTIWWPSVLTNNCEGNQFGEGGVLRPRHLKQVKSTKKILLTYLLLSYVCCQTNFPECAFSGKL